MTELKKISLPIDPYLIKVQESLTQKSNNLVLSASPGSGKTTRVPPALLTVTNKKILVLEPRRIAAIASCYRIAEENNWTVGQEIGFEVRLENQVSQNSKIIFITEAILTKKMLSDPLLSDYGVIVLDEFHERSIHTDLAISLLKELQELERPDLKIIVMSATLATQPLCDFLGAELIDIQIPPHELTVIHHHKSLSRIMNEDFYQKIGDVIKTAIHSKAQNILVFLPGKGEINKLSQRLSSQISNEYEILELHGSLSLADQKKVLAPSLNKKIILATNIAESSLTIDGVDTVIDSGVARSSSYNIKTGTHKLEVTQISQFSAKQRQGRANRQKNGTCYKLWTKLDEQGQPQSETPELLRSDLSETILNLKKMGIQNLEHFSWFQKPDSLLLQHGVEKLKSFGFLDEHQRLTLRGTQALFFNIPIEISNLLIEFLQYKNIEEACFWATLIFEKQSLKIEQDISELYQDKERFINHPLFKKSYSQLFKKAQDFIRLYSKDFPNQKEPISTAELFTRALSWQICKRRSPQSDSALNFNGKGIKVLIKNNDSFLYFIGLDFIELPSGNDLNCSLYFKLNDSAVVEKCLSHKIVKKMHLDFNSQKQKFTKTEEDCLGAIIIKSRLLSEPTASEISSQISQVAMVEIKKIFDQSEKLNQWLKRYQIMNSAYPQSFPELDEAFWKELSEYACAGKNTIAEILNSDFMPLIQQILGVEKIKQMQKELPTSFDSPKGRTIYVYYDENGQAQAQSRLQDFFGIQKHPSILNGKKPIVLTLLAPSGRPIQITSDIISFWTSSYPEIKKEMKGRYPKHDW